MIGQAKTLAGDNAKATTALNTTVLQENCRLGLRKLHDCAFFHK